MGWDQSAVDVSQNKLKLIRLSLGAWMATTIYQRLTDYVGSPRTWTKGTPRTKDAAGNPILPSQITPTGVSARAPLTGGPSQPLQPTILPPAKVGAAYAPTPVQAAQRQLMQEQSAAEKQRLRGRSATLLTGSSGLLDVPSTSRRSLLGY